ncbi:DegV family protein [Clostridium fallax]|uniref:EDD domain protein, DegV family n=1 Tax=Clostridium fallax TaxID=1533 RepID=A0A1M4W2U9_9CLOT|nr:DegV family protein [Clostridium fallax]SHE75529.1 EDD domain protein, DegV family [Clostridium fallax]SQB22850.1 degV family protein [Clostridium fallax]
MKEYIILTDSSCDLPINLIKSLNVKYLGLVCNYKGNEIIEDGGQSLDYKTFYDSMRNGETPSTSQINVFRFTEEFEKHIKEGKGILYISFSSGLSGTYNSALLAREEILEKYPDADISIVDSRAASLGVGLLVYYSCCYKSQGKSKEEVVKWIEETKDKVCHFFTVNDLHHLKRGGRISTTAAIVGSILNIKPVLYVDDEGKLVIFNKVKGNKKAIKSLFEQFETHIINWEDQTIFISHGDNLADAEFLAKMIKEKYNVQNIIINNLGLAIGSHAGPGMLGLFFLGAYKRP